MKATEDRDREDGNDDPPPGPDELFNLRDGVEPDWRRFAKLEALRYISIHGRLEPYGPPWDEFLPPDHWHICGVTAAGCRYRIAECVHHTHYQLVRDALTKLWRAALPKAPPSGGPNGARGRFSQPAGRPRPQN